MESEITSCGICFESYNEGGRKPLLLPCSHSFCQNCLQTLESLGKEKCAFCKKSWGQTTVKNFPICYQLIPAGASAQGKHRLATCGPHGKEITFWCASCGLPICNACLEYEHSKCKFMMIQNYRDGESQKEYERIVHEILENMSQSNELLSIFKSFDIELKNATEKGLMWRSKSQTRYDEYCTEGSDGSAYLPFPQKQKEAQEALETLNKEAPTATLLFHVARAYQNSKESSIEDFIKSLRQSAEEKMFRRPSESSNKETKKKETLVTPFRDGEIWTIKDTTAAIKATRVLRTTTARPILLNVTGVNWAEDVLLKQLLEIAELRCPVRVQFLDLFWTPERASEKENQSRLQTLLKHSYQCTVTQFWAHLDEGGVKKLPNTVESVGLVLKDCQDLKALKALYGQAFARPFFGPVRKKWTNLSEINFCFAKTIKDRSWTSERVWNADGSQLVASSAGLGIQLGLHFPLMTPADLTWMTDIIRKVTDCFRYSQLIKNVYLPGSSFGADLYVNILKGCGLRCQVHFPNHQLQDSEVIESYSGIGCSVVWDLEAIHPFGSTDGAPVLWKWLGHSADTAAEKLSY